MQRLVFTDDEYDTLKKVLSDWGTIEPHDADYDKVEALRVQFKEFDAADAEPAEVD